MKRRRMSRRRISHIKMDPEMCAFPGQTNVEAGEQEKGHEIKAAEDAKTQHGCMPLLPASVWTKLTNAKVAWSTRWTVKGLLPVRPHIVLTVNVDLPAGHGFSL